VVVKVARNIDQTTLDAPDFVLSRSIAKQAAESRTTGGHGGCRGRFDVFEKQPQ